MTAKQRFIIGILTVKNKSLQLENQFVDVSNVLLLKLYHNISQGYIESLIAQKNQIFSCVFLTKFCLPSVVYQSSFYFRLLFRKRLQNTFVTPCFK